MFAQQEVVLYIHSLDLSQKKYLHVHGHSHDITTLQDATIFCLEPADNDHFYLRMVPSLTCGDVGKKSLDIWDAQNPKLILYAPNQHENQKFIISSSDMSIFTYDGRFLLTNEQPLFVQFVSRLRVMSFNIQECLNKEFGSLSWNDRASVSSYSKYESGRDIATLIQRFKPHVTCLQEYSNNNGCKALSKSRPATYSCGADPGWRSLLQNPIILDGFKVVVEGQREDLADNRCFSYVGLEVPVVGHVLIVNIHVTFKQKYQQNNVLILMNFISKQLQQGTHIILTGDFNFKSTSPLYDIISQRLIPLTTQRIDHIFCSTGLMDAIKVQSCLSDASDHDPVMVEFRWADSTERFQKMNHTFKVW